MSYTGGKYLSKFSLKGEEDRSPEVVCASPRTTVHNVWRWRVKAIVTLGIK